jgi:predicted nucleic acid-binding protein
LALSVYLDASLIVSLFVDDAFTQRANSAFRTSPDALVVSDFAAAEFASVIARQVRTAKLSSESASKIFSDFDVWTATWATDAETQTADIVRAGAILRRLDINLRAPDAIHIAIAQRIGAQLATFDKKMAESARALGLPLVPL